MKRWQAKVWAAWLPLAVAAAVCAAAAGCDGMDLLRRAPTGGTPSGPEAKAGYTILLCPPYAGADRARLSAEAKRKTQSATGWTGVYVVHEERTSGLYLGQYASQEEAERDLQRARQYKTPQGAQPFRTAVVTRRPGHRVGRPEWDLAGATGYYTVVIAEFYSEPGVTEDRMELTVANCEDLRRQNVEAYYYHGPAKSYVTIGVFPVEAYRMEETSDGGVRAVIEDERIAKILKERPYLAVNGYQEVVSLPNPVTGRLDRLYTSTYVHAISAFLVGKTEPPPPRRRQPQPRQGP
jgi:hypothetical protein